MNLPTLFKKTSTGADQEWTISVEIRSPTMPGSNTGPAIVTRFGQVGGKIQEAIDFITEGKNVGKRNETTPLQQANAEASGQWEKKLKKGYVQSLGDAQAGKIDAAIEGGIFPMLAHRFDEQGHKIVYPAYAQPKFDGHRCIAVIEGGKVTLWSRTRKPITGLPHIVAALTQMGADNDIVDAVLDGELYNHAYRTKFEELTSFIRNPEPKAGCEAVQYHIYDLVEGQAQIHRTHALSGVNMSAPLIQVETISVADEDDLMLAFDRFLAEGYEGAMVRNAGGLYVNKRSYDLQKVKTMLDGEFTIVGVEAGRGKMSDKAIFVCKTDDGTEFKAKMKGTLESLKQYILQPELAIGKMLTVQYQGITGKSKVPRFPVGLRLKVDI